MIQVLWDADPRQEAEKVAELARSNKGIVEILDKLPIDVDSKNQIQEAITSVRGFNGLGKVIETIDQGNLKVFRILVKTGALTGENATVFKITSPESIEALDVILKQSHPYVKDMIQILWDTDVRQGFEKVYELARSDKVSVEILDSLPLDRDSKNQSQSESVKGFNGLEKVIETIEQGNLKIFSLLVETGALTTEKNSSFKITGLKTLQALEAILKQSHSSTKDMIQILWDADHKRRDFEKVYELARSDKVSVEMLDSLPFDMDLKSQSQSESMKGFSGLEKVIEDH